MTTLREFVVDYFMTECGYTSENIGEYMKQNFDLLPAKKFSNIKVKEEIDAPWIGPEHGVITYVLLENGYYVAIRSAIIRGYCDYRFPFRTRPYKSYYSKMYDEFEEENKIYPKSKHNTTIITHKICRHFKIPRPRVTYILIKNIEGKCYTPPSDPKRCRERHILIMYHKHKPTSFLTIAEEVGHALNYMKNGSYRERKAHDKKQLTCVRRILRYCKKKNYWRKKDVSI